MQMTVRTHRGNRITMSISVSSDESQVFFRPPGDNQWHDLVSCNDIFDHTESVECRCEHRSMVFPVPDPGPQYLFWQRRLRETVGQWFISSKKIDTLPLHLFEMAVYYTPYVLGQEWPSRLYLTFKGGLVVWHDEDRKPMTPDRMKNEFFFHVKNGQCLETFTFVTGADSLGMESFFEIRDVNSTSDTALSHFAEMCDLCHKQIMTASSIILEEKGKK